MRRWTCSLLNCATVFLFILAYGSGTALAQNQVDLGHPTLSPVTFTVANRDFDRDMTIAFDALTDVTINSAGMRFDPRSGDSTIRVIIREVDTSGGGIGTRGPALASGTADISDHGMGFYDVPINFTFTAGKRYDIAFDSDWGDRLSTFEAYPFDPSLAGYATYDVAGIIRVVDGGQNFFRPEGDGGYPNTGMNHFRVSVLPFTANDFKSPMGKKKNLGSTIPVKFTLFFDGVEVQGQDELDFVLALIGSESDCPRIMILDVTDPADEIGLELPEDLNNVGEGGELGDCFRYSDGNWIYNLRLPDDVFFSGRTYLVEVELDGVVLKIGNDVFQIK